MALFYRDHDDESSNSAVQHTLTHRIHVWYICKQCGYIDGKCYHIYIAYMDPMGSGKHTTYDHTIYTIRKEIMAKAPGK